MHGDALKVRLMAPPIDNAANDALIALLADWLGVAKRDVQIVAGAAGRAKVVEVAGVSEAQVKQLATRASAR
jgi:uncharacterized protein YggU (UPF0235/DUF167 family)